MNSEGYKRTENLTKTYKRNDPYVGDDAIYVPLQEYTPLGTSSNYRMLITKELFIEAYNKWIKGTSNE